MSRQALAILSDQLVYLTALSYLAATLLFGVEFAYRVTWGGRTAVLVCLAGVAGNLAAAITRALATGRVPWANMYEFSIMSSLGLAAGLLVLAVRRPEARSLGAFILPAALGTLLVGRFLLYADPAPLPPALQSGWIRIHVFTAIVGAAALMLASLLSVVYLFKDRQERRPRPPAAPLIAGGAQAVDEREAQATIERYSGPGAAPAARPVARPGEPRSRLDRLPPAKVLDELAYKTAIFGFPIWTVGIVLGAIWAQSAWGRYWGWDPKETWSFIVWTIYAAYLHARATAGWRGRRAAAIAVVGLASLLINYYLVNTVLVGLHSYSGL
jgi:cytochrome c-type biogenesis protein CcsB